MSTLLLAIGSIVISVAAQFFLKAGMSAPAVQVALSQPSVARTALAALSNPFVLGGLLLYGLGAIVWLGVLARWDVSKAYPLVGLGFALTVVAGALMGEHVTGPRVLGVALIAVGAFLVGRS